MSCQGNRCKRNVAPDPGDAPGTVSCGRPVTHVGHAEGGVFEIDVGATAGKFELTFNTFNQPDRIEVAQAGVLLGGTECVGTQAQCPGEYPGVNGTLWYHCKQGGECTTQVPFNGPSSVIRVTIFPLCQNPTGETDWNFTVGCAH